MLQSGQTQFKNLEALATRFLRCVLAILGHKRQCELVNVN